MFVSTFIGFLSGWHRLARDYRATADFKGIDRFALQSVTLSSFGHYWHCVTLASNAAGLRISVWFLFRLGHPPLFIPWADITVYSVRGLFGRRIQFAFVKVPEVPVTIGRGVAERLLDNKPTSNEGLAHLDLPGGDSY